MSSSSPISSLANAIEESRQFKEIFDILDLGKCGYLTVDNLKSSGAIPEAILNEVEDSFEQKISFSEFCALLKKVRDNPVVQAEYERKSPRANRRDSFFDFTRQSILNSRRQSRITVQITGEEDVNSPNNQLSPGNELSPRAKLRLKPLQEDDMLQESNVVNNDSFEKRIAELEYENHELVEEKRDLELKLKASVDAAIASESRLTRECDKLNAELDRLRSEKRDNGNSNESSRRSSVYSQLYMLHRRKSSNNSSVGDDDLETSKEKDETNSGGTLVRIFPPLPSISNQETIKIKQEFRELKRANMELQRLLKASRERVLKLEQDRGYSERKSTILMHQMSGLNEALAFKKNEMELRKRGKELEERVKQLENELRVYRKNQVSSERNRKQSTSVDLGIDFDGEIGNKHFQRGSIDANINIDAGKEPLLRKGSATHCANESASQTAKESATQGAIRIVKSSSEQESKSKKGKCRLWGGCMSCCGRDDTKE
eukprot:CAMPEP_0184486000 /NCGR_PEP_ID=MMETSP0113_2-20130426/7557_1 /TAXON_ID=91329 /ORGANISM="Norrisiella sphaerica, Strain BC52" /LENGTH=488 /DNA_ID=CAMNT_0026867695 /DNA_START=341 /DNA_END=1807 /DNA_ORIENTATION=-